MSPGAMNAGTWPPNCHVCMAPLGGSDRCGRCGALHGAWRRCGGCGALAETLRKDGVIYLCAACGRPRVPVERPELALSGMERPALDRVQQAFRDSLVAKGLGYLALALGVFSGLIAALGFAVGWTTLALIFSVFLGILVLGTFIAFRTGGRARARADDAMRDALGSAAMDALRARPQLTAPELAALMGVQPDVAEAGLARLPARPDFPVETSLEGSEHDGLVRYRLPGVHPQTRVEAAPDQPAKEVTQLASDPSSGLSEEDALDARMRAASEAAKAKRGGT